MANKEVAKVSKQVKVVEEVAKPLYIGTPTCELPIFRTAELVDEVGKLPQGFNVRIVGEQGQAWEIDEGFVSKYFVLLAEV